MVHVGIEGMMGEFWDTPFIDEVDDFVILCSER
jgi:hypothetical protein